MNKLDLSIVLEDYTEFKESLEKNLLGLRKNLLLISEKNKQDILTSIDNSNRKDTLKFIDTAYSINNNLRIINELCICDFGEMKNNDNLVTTPTQMTLVQEAESDQEQCIETISLNEVKVNTKPLSFYYDEYVLSVASWRDLAKKLLEKMFADNPEIFSEFIYDPSLNGIKSDYFSHTSKGMVAPLKLQNVHFKIFVDIDKLLLNNKRILKNVLSAYGLPPAKLFITVVDTHQQKVG